MSLGGDWSVVRICFCLAIPSRNFSLGSVQLGVDLVHFDFGVRCRLDAVFLLVAGSAAISAPTCRWWSFSLLSVLRGFDAVAVSGLGRSTVWSSGVPNAGFVVCGVDLLFRCFPDVANLLFFLYRSRWVWVSSVWIAE